MNNNSLFLNILPSIFAETVEIPINPVAGYNSITYGKTYDPLNKYPQNDHVAIIQIMDLPKLYDEIFGYLYKFIEYHVPEASPSEIYFEIKETVNLGLHIKAYLYGYYDKGFEEDVTSLLQDLHGYIPDESLEWLLRDLFPDYHGSNNLDSLNPFFTPAE